MLDVACFPRKPVCVFNSKMSAMFATQLFFFVLYILEKAYVGIVLYINYWDYGGIPFSADLSVVFYALYKETDELTSMKFYYCYIPSWEVWVVQKCLYSFWKYSWGRSKTCLNSDFYVFYFHTNARIYFTITIIIMKRIEFDLHAWYGYGLFGIVISLLEIIYWPLKNLL